MGFKVIETKEEFFAAAKARLLWGNLGCPDEAPRWDHLYAWYDFSNKVLSDDFSWRTQDFAVLVEDDGEDTSPPTASKD